MDVIEAFADRSIRRGLGFAGLAIGLVMLALSFDAALAFRMGADLAAVVAVVLLVSAWSASRRDLRHGETWAEIRALRPEFAAVLSRSEIQRRLAETLRRRLLWHAERIGLLALALWTAAALMSLLR